jgi:hypothetical protein
MRSGLLRLFFCSAIVIVTTTKFTLAQQYSADTSFVHEGKKKIVASYAAAIQQQSRLYNGSDYVMYISRDEEHPYFTLGDWIFGSVTYWNELYENVPLMYDISTDQIITEHNRGNPIKLHPEKVQAFTLNDHLFVKLKPDANNKIQEGFYDQLYKGDSKVYARHIKVYREKLESKEVIPIYNEVTRYYVLKDSTYYPVKSKGSVIKVFADKKAEVKSFVRKNRIKVSSDREDAFVRIARHYDSLKD